MLIGLIPFWSLHLNHRMNSGQELQACYAAHVCDVPICAERPHLATLVISDMLSVGMPNVAI